ncbi:hypothetical protein BGZ96_010658 [Linnemannia gamsii]|uniref:Glucose-methanol-choline oxidoreductase N-terminal domain-containing protein n=1 Tax=Linnemannia gamsii TaxID=64522 RepID=A0ABQ7JUI8_9FUNG|nr:hypothetical protein BGZ96_010658 [Linnemannia gamsii]
MFDSAPDREKMLSAVAKLSKVAQVLKYRSQEGKAPWDQNKDTLVHYDYIVLGGGSAGSVVASRLAEDPAVNVLVLEAGYSDEVLTSRAPGLYNTIFQSDADWNYETIPQTHAGNRTLMQPRGKLLGGCSSINAMMYHRGPASDYDEWEALGNPGWSFKECLPYFKKSEGFNDPNLPVDHPHGPLTHRVRYPELETFDPAAHGTDGPWQVTFHHLFELSNRFVAASRAEGIPFNKDFNGESTLGVNRIQTFIQRDGIRSSLSRAFLRSEDVVPGGKNGRGTVRVVFGADAKRILFQVKRGVKMASGIEFLDHNNVRRRVMATREILVCGGTFGSPQLLMASGVGTSPQPSIPHFHTLAGVGANLQDHIGLNVTFRARDRCQTLNQEYGSYSAMKSLFQYVASGTGPLTTQVGECVIFVRLEDIAPEWVAQEKANGTYQERASGPESPHLEIILLPGYVRRHGTILAPDFKSYFTVTALLMNPCSSGTFKITSSKPTGNKTDVDVKGVVDPNYMAESFDARVLAQGVKFIRRIGRRLNNDPDVGGREVFPGEATVPDHDDKALEKYAREAVETYYHPVGTCKMGPVSDPTTVVDNRLNVHGIERLRVIDASVMPKLVAAHTCAPTVMIAERAADFIKEDWSSYSRTGQGVQTSSAEARL